MINKITPSTNYRHQLLIAILLGAWLYLFLAIIGPFDAVELSLKIRIQLMIGYGFVTIFAYLVCIPVQNWVYRKLGYWNSLMEIATLMLFSIICLPASYRYYITDWVRGDYGFPRFVLEIYLPTLVILLPLLALARRFAARKSAESSAPPPTVLTASDWIQLSGSNKLDILRLRADQLVALSAANNYVTVYYLEEGTLRKKLLRSTLTKMQEEVPLLLRVHRSHLINPHHFLEWKGTTTAVLTQLEIPVTQAYKEDLLKRLQFRP
jgi:hypothetical protein